MRTSAGPARALLILSVAVIAIATLVPRGGTPSGPSICILCGHRGLSDFLSNILLFAPFGFALGLERRSLRTAVLAGALFSICIEAAQLRIIAGRDANIGDVIANTLGAAFGWVVAASRHAWLAREITSRRAAVVAAATATLLLGALALFTPSLTNIAWHMQWTARFGNMAPYEGAVVATRIGPLDIPGNRRIEQTDSVRGMLFNAPLQVLATAHRPDAIAPIVSIYDAEQREVMLLGADRADLIYRYRMVADLLRLDHGDLRVHQAFEDLVEGQLFSLVWNVDRKGWCLELDGARQCGRGFTVGDTWTLLMALDWGTDERAILRVLWLWLVFVPAGVLIRSRFALAATALAAAVPLLLGPPLLGFAFTPWPQLVAVLAGLATGGALAARLRQWDMRASVTDIGRNR